MQLSELKKFGWGTLQEQQFVAFEDHDHQPARVLDVHRSVIHVVAPDLDLSLPVPLKLDGGPVTVGDWVLIDPAAPRIVQRLERSSLFRRRAPGTDRGRHTTTARQLHQLPGGAWLMDTPGMRELQLTDVQSGLEDVFAEIGAFANSCQFAGCAHEEEPGCGIAAAVASGDVDPDRVSRWRKLVREEAHNRESIAERRARDKLIGKYYKSVISENQRRKGRGPGN